MTDHDLFSYPHQPGFRERETSKEAADSMRRTSNRVQELVLGQLARHPGGLTVHEVAELLAMTVASVQPRFSELRVLGKIAASGERRKNASGRRAHVWVAK